MSSGRFCWMMNSWRLGSMALSWDVLMVFFKGSTCEFLLTRLTILRSEPFKLQISSKLMNYDSRILIASIRNLGKCPCPRCLIPLSQVHNLGMPRDMSQREVMAHVDNAEWQGKVFAAQRLIYEKNSLVNGAAIEALLQDVSLVPTSVRLIHARLLLLPWKLKEWFSRMPFLRDCLP